MTPTPRTPRTAHSAPPDALPAWGALCFFLSGAAGLLYEVVWSKQLAYLLGNSLHAVATVVAAFLCGLALGARFLGVPLSRRGNGARTYAWLELAVGLLGLAWLPLLRGLDPLVGQMYRALGGEGAAFAAARFGLLFALLIPPTALMGATLPVLVAHFERGRVGPALARLYALNTFGAVAGSVAGGFALLPGVGLLVTTWVAAAVNLGVAVLAWVAGRAGPARTDAPRAAAAPEAPSMPAAAGEGLAGGARTTFALLFALSGFAALVFQIAWVRLFGLMFGTSVYSFSAVLGVYLLGLALGSVIVGRFMRAGVSLAGFARLQLAIAAIAALELFAFSRLPEWMFGLATRSGADWSALFAGEVGLTALLLLAPCALLGALFPIATRLLQQRDGGHAAGFAYAVNTAGTIAGSLAAGFFLVPTLGVQGTHLAALLLSGAIGLAALALARARGEAGNRALLVGLGAGAAIAAVAALAPRWDPALMSAGPFRPVQAVGLDSYARFKGGVGGTVWRATRAHKVLYYREGVNGSVLVGTDEQGLNRWLKVGGKIDASTEDMETQVLLGLIPAVLADSGTRALVIGLGSGITAAAVLAGGAGITDVVELEPGVIEASRFFHAPGENPLDDPRVRLVRGDARTHLAHGGGRYGLIVSEPSNPWIAGVNNLFTVDFYRLVRAHLEPGGVFCQWMQLYELTPATFASMVASYRTVFPDGQVFAVWRAVDVLLVAVPDTRRFALERLNSPAAQRMLERAKIGSPESLAMYYAGPLSALAAVTARATLNLDDRPVVEYRAPRDLVTVGRSALHGHPEVAALVPFAEAPPAGPLFSAWTPERWFESRARGLIAEGEDARAASAVHGAQAAGFSALADRLTVEMEAGRRRQRGLLQVEQARLLLAAGRNAEGLRALEQATELDPANGRTWIMLADVRRLSGDLAGAEAALAHGHANEDPEIQAEAVSVAGMLEISRHRPLVAAERFREAQQLSPRLARSYVLEARARITGNDTTGAVAALRRGLALIPGDPEILATFDAIGVRP